MNECVEFEREISFKDYESKFKIIFYESNEQHANFYESNTDLKPLQYKSEINDIFSIDNKYILTYKLKLEESKSSSSIVVDLPKISSENKLKQSNDIVTINVGGKLFTTRKSTLTSYSSSILCAILNGKHTVSYDKDGNIFIDRDPKLFEYILNYLRDPNQLDIERLDKVTRRRLYIELDYYCIDILGHKPFSNLYLNNFTIDILSKRQWKPQQCRLTLTYENTVFGLNDKSGLYSFDIEFGSLLEHLIDSIYIVCFTVTDNLIYVYLSNKILLVYSTVKKKLINRINLREINSIVDMKYIAKDTLIVIYHTSMCCVLYIEEEGKVRTVDLLNGACKNQMSVIENTDMVVIGCKNGSMIVMDYVENKIVSTLNLHRMGNLKVRTVRDYIFCYGHNFLKVFQYIGDENFDHVITIKKPIYDAYIQNNMLILYDQSNYLDFWDIKTKELIYSQDINVSIDNYPINNVSVTGSDCGTKIFLVENNSCTIIKYVTTL